MANAPTVQSLDQIMASLQPGYAAQQGIIGQQIANTDATYKAQSLALDAAKTQGFNQINTNATGKGNSFSGIPVDEQANYLSTTYLPGVQQAQAKQNADKLTLAGQMAALNTDQRNQALGVQQNQQSALNQWNLQQEQIAASAREAAANRAASAAAAAADRAYQQSQQAPIYSYSKNKAGGYDTQGGVDLATAVKSQGGTISTLVNLLANGDAKDRAAAKKYQTNIANGVNPVIAANQLYMDRPTAFYLGGSF